MAVLEIVPSDPGHAVGIPNDEVGIHSDRDRTLVAIESGEPGGLLGQPSAQLRQPDPTICRPRPGRRQPQLKRADATPGLTEVPIIEPLDFGRRRGMIGDDHAQAPLDQAVPQRVPMLADVPTMGEAASFTFEVSSTFGILAPAGTPKPIIERLNSEFARAVQLPDVKERLLQQGAFAASTTPEEAAQRIRSEIAMWAKVINEANVKPD